ncbi:hypothetical protein [Paracidovorax sp. MALMAid1276]|uniref:hypothetical protein n=1 Tax=Paracidovorax sp. MALMAid1276 TaxID=3411631 RepID=UPI003B9C5299
MDIVIVYVDDADHAQHVLAPLLARESAAQTRWVLVACAPRMTHRISKWVSHSARENWRTKWADKLFAQIVPLLPGGAAAVSTVIAKGPLAELTEQLQAQSAEPAQVLDARRPKVDTVAPDATAPRPPRSGWTPVRNTLGSLLAGCSALWVLAAE